LVKSGSQVLAKTLHMFTPPDAYSVEVQQPEGPRFDADAVYNGENRPFGALISYVVNKPEEKKEVKAEATKDKKGVKPAVAESKDVKKDESKSKVKYDSIKFQVFNAKNELIRTIKFKAPEENGLNRFSWNLNQKGVQSPSRDQPRGSSEPGGLTVLPGTYKVRMTFGDKKDSTNVTVKDDPRYTTSSSIIEARYAMLKEL
jgi:hypothetical protein